MTRKRTKKAEQHQPTSRFLQLPGVLRNAIYTCCITDDADCVIMQRSDQTAEAKKIIPWTYFHLAQVNRQIKAEFLPMSLRGFTHCVRLHDLASYMQTFITPNRFARGAVQIDERELWNGDGVMVVDIAPVLRLLPLRPGIVLGAYVQERTSPWTFLGESWAYDDTLKGIASPSDVGLLMGLWDRSYRTRKWLVYAARAVEELRITFTEQDLCSVRIVVKPAAKEWWMDWAGAEDGYVPPRVNVELERWVEATGYRAGWKHGALVVEGATRWG